MTPAINDRYRLNLILTVLFIFGVGVSLYSIYSLPYTLRLAEGYQPEFLKVYSIVGSTALLGSLALFWALRYKKEIIVYRDRIIDTSKAKREANDASGKTTINLEPIKSALTNSTNEKELLNSSIQTICKQLDAGQGAAYLVLEENGKRKVELSGGFALSYGESAVVSYELGEGLIGQVAATGNTLFIDDVPEGYITVLSGLGKASPKYVLIVPIKKDQKILGVLEIASFTKQTDDERKFVEECALLMGEKVLSKS